MIGPPSGTRIWLVAGQTDLRKGVDGLCALVQAHLNESAFTGEVYLFRGKSGNKIKVLWATPEGTSFLYKRLNDAKECFTKHSFAASIPFIAARTVLTSRRSPTTICAPSC
jgi:transposase